MGIKLQFDRINDRNQEALTHLKGCPIISLVEFTQVEGRDSSRTELLELSVLCECAPPPSSAPGCSDRLRIE